MVLGIPGEIHQDEFRVGASPFLVGQLVQRGHQVLVETGAGERSLYSDADYQEAGAVIVPSPEKLYGQAECILKVRKPRPVEYDLIRPDHILLAYFHPLTNIETMRALLARGCSCFAYEQFTDQSGRRPLLELEGQLTGQLAVQFGACLMPVSSGGRGTMLGAFPGVTPPQVVILGTTPTGVSAAISAARLGANVFLMADGDAACSAVRAALPRCISVVPRTPEHYRKILPSTDLLISAPQDMDGRAPEMLSEADLALLPRGAVVMDLAIGYGGSIATATATTHENPTYVKEGITHFCVPNLTGVVPVTASEALSNALLPILLQLVEGNLPDCALTDPNLRNALIIYEGRVTHPRLAEILNLPFHDPGKLVENGS